MSCTTILAGKKATYDGSTMIARNDDSPSGLFAPKKFVVVEPEEQAKEYQSKMTGPKVELPKEAFRYTCCPNATGSVGIWAASGVNEYNVGMTATETITSNPRVQGADPVLESGRKISLFWCFPISKQPERVFCGWESFWRNMARMRATGLPFPIRRKSGIWKRSAVITGWQRGCRMTEW